MKEIISTLLLAILFAGCSGEKDPVRYLENEENGLRKTVSLGDVIYTIQYKSPAYIARMEHLNKEEEMARIRQLKGMAWFNISFRIENYNQSPLRYKISGLEEYSARQNYYLNEAPKDIYLLYGNDTLYPNSYWFENNQNLALHETIIVGFKLPGTTVKPDENLQLAFYDRVFRNGIIKTIIKKEDLEDIPEL